MTRFFFLLIYSFLQKKCIKHSVHTCIDLNTAVMNLLISKLKLILVIWGT